MASRPTARDVKHVLLGIFWKRCAAHSCEVMLLLLIIHGSGHLLLRADRRIAQKHPKASKAKRHSDGRGLGERPESRFGGGQLTWLVRNDVKRSWASSERERESCMFLPPIESSKAMAYYGILYIMSMGGCELDLCDQQNNPDIGGTVS